MRWIFGLMLVTTAFAGCTENDAADDANETDEGDDVGEADDAASPPPPPPAPPEPPATQPPPAPPEVPVAPVPFQMDGTGCNELLVLFNIPLEVARGFVPESYTITGQDAGRAEAFAGLKVCDDLLIDTVSIGPGSTSDVGVFIDAPDGTDGFHYYQTWWLTDNYELASHLVRQGWRAGWTVGTTLTDSRAQGLAGDVSFTVPWSDGEYGGSASVLGPPVPAENVAKGWYDGPLGLVTVAKVLSGTEIGGSVGTLTAAEGSPMAELADGTSVNGVALFNVYSMTGTVGPEG